MERVLAGSQRELRITYVREEIGVNNVEGGWTLPGYNSRQKYQDAYHVMARFFIWVEKNYKKSLVKELDKVMRDKAYARDFWKNETGKTVNQLWAVYSANPSLG